MRIGFACIVVADIYFIYIFFKFKKKLSMLVMQNLFFDDHIILRVKIKKNNLHLLACFVNYSTCKDPKKNRSSILLEKKLAAGYTSNLFLVVARERRNR